MRLLLLVLILLSTSCRNKGSNTTPNNAVLRQQVETYKELSAELQDADGFINTDHCDSLLFSSLLAVARNEPINIRAARDASGQWFRRPAQDCFSSGASRSTISRDMFIGLMIYILHFEDVEAVNALWEYGSDHGWDMGQADSQETRLGRTQWNPATIGLLAMVRYKLTGRDSILRHTPQVYSADPGFKSHLSLLKLNLVAKLRSLNLYEERTIRLIKARNPSNALAHTTHSRLLGGDYTRPIALLLAQFPIDRLPTSEDWCEEWYTQRAAGDPSLKPCAPGTTHSGGDFLYAAGLLFNTI